VTVLVSHEEIDVGLCVSSGQVFRFERRGDWYEGVDGSSIVRARQVEGGWEISPEGRQLFQLDISLNQIEKEVLERGPELRSRIGKHSGLRVLRQSYAHETLFSFLCTPNNNLSRIIPMVRRLGAYGREVADGHFEFPSIARIAEIDESELRAAGFGYRARTIPNVAQELLRRSPTWLESLRDVPYPVARDSLCELSGIGRKIADCVCLVGLWHQEAVPVDTHLWQAACEIYFPEWRGTALTQTKYEAVGNLMREKFGRLAGWAHQYLFYDRVLSYRNGKPPVYSN
jgi:N-glycosylase/DNA lyase